MSWLQRQADQRGFVQTDLEIRHQNQPRRISPVSLILESCIRELNQHGQIKTLNWSLEEITANDDNGCTKGAFA